MAAHALPRGERTQLRFGSGSTRSRRHTKSTEAECASHDEEDCSVSGLGIFGGEENDVADHHERGTAEHDDASSLDLHRDVRELKNRHQRTFDGHRTVRETHQDGEEGSHDVRRDRKQLLGDSRFFRIDGSNNSRSEESNTLNRDIVQQENKTDHERSRSKDSLLDSTSVHLVQNRGRSDMLGLDSTGGKVLLLLR